MRNKVSEVLWGLCFIALGFAIAAKSIWDFDIFFDGWWTLFIIVPSFIGMIRSKFGIGSTIVFIIGVFLLLASQPAIGDNIQKLLLPIIFIFIGLRIVLQNTVGNRPRIDYRGENGQNTEFEQGMNNSQNIYMDGISPNGLPEYNATFSSNNVNFQHQFQGASLNSVFGSLVFDLRNAVIDQDVEINATSIFAGIDIYIPEGVNIKVNSVPIFGGVSNKVNRNHDVNAPTIYLKSTCMFGGIDIK